MRRAAELVGTFGMAASTHWLATAVAAGVLERGGNAFDAVVAGGFALHAAQPHQNGPGGEAPALFWSAREHRVRVLAGQGVSPAGATIERFAGLGLDAVPGTGLLAATVPGAIGAWLTLLDEYGTMSLEQVLSPAIELLRGGVWAGAHLRGELASVAELFASSWSTSEAQWGAARTAAESGGLVRNPELAGTYERMLAHARSASGSRSAQIRAALDWWYRGPVAEAIGRFSTQTEWLDTSGAPHSGLLSSDDLASWDASFEEPLTVEYADALVAKTGPWGQGPVFLQQLQLLRGYELGSMSRAERAHVIVESSKLAFADREAWYGDGAEPELIAELISSGYADRRRRLIGEGASTEIRPGYPLGRQPRLAAPVDGGGFSWAALGAGEPARHEHAAPAPATTRVYGDTCHIDVVDRFGNMVSATPSGGWLQSSPTIPGLGFCLGTRAQMFWLEPGLPSSLRPRTRPRTTLSPTLALRDGEPWLAFGTPGGDQQDQWSLSAFLTLLHDGVGIGAAVAAPRFHSEHVASSFFPRAAQPNRLVAERDVDDDVLAGLRERGHEVIEVARGTLGKVTAVQRDGGVLRAAADPRIGEPHAAGR